MRGDGCYVWDEHGNRYLDGLSALFCVNAGHGRERARRRGRASRRDELGYYTNWSYAHPRAIELAARVAELAPGDLNRVFFTSGGSEAVESAWKLARNYHRLRGEGTRTKVIARETRLPRHHARRARRDRAHRRCAAQFEPLDAGRVPRAEHEQLPLAGGPRPAVGADEIEERILFEGPETVAAVILEPVQNAGGCFTPPEGYFQRVREICDRYGVLLISDEVICSWGRLGYYFGSERYDYLPDIITTAKGLTSAYAPMGAVFVVATGSPSRSWRARRCSLTASRSAATRSPGRSRWRTSTSSSARTSAGTCCAKEAEFRAAARVAARPADRRRRARRRLLPGDRARQGQGDEGDVQRRGVRGPPARIPLRRALPARADLPRRRPRRPRDPALARR